MKKSNYPEIMVQTNKLSKRYDELIALEDLTLDIPMGKIFGYIGHNGAGKTTTIRILAGLIKSTSGSASIAGADLNSDRDRLKQLVGYMPDEFGVYDQMRVWEYLDFFGAAFKIPIRKRRMRIDEVLEITEAEYMRDRFVDTLSKGMKQKIGIARTLMHDPQVLLLDEPANGLDPRARIEMRNLLRQLADRGKTLLVSSHILPELASVCDLVGIIHQGRLQAAGPITEVLSSITRDRIIEIKIAGDPAYIEKILKSHACCSHVEVSKTYGSSLKFHFDGNDAQQVELLSSLTRQNCRILSFQEVPLSLEDAFMALSGIGREKNNYKNNVSEQDASAIGSKE